MNQTLWNEFIEGKTVVNCRTENQAQKFLKICDGKGMKWYPDTKLTSHTNWEQYKEKTCYCNKFNDNNNKLSFTEEDYYKNELHLKVITFKQLMKSDKPEVGKQYKGWEILKMIEGGKLKDEDVVTDRKGEDNEVGYLIHNRVIDYITQYQPFTVKTPEKHYLTFDEARKTGKKFKYKGWDKYCNLNDILNFLSGMDNKVINNRLDECVWEVEE